jgi:xylulokinase
MAVVCVDAGTTMIKAVGYADDGTEAAVVRQVTQVSRTRPEWAEQDMTSVWEAVASCVRQVVERMGTGVDYLAVTAQGDGSWLVDRDGEPTGPAILWNDGRAAETVDGWTRAGVLERAFRVNGSLTFAGLPNAILSWLREHDPDRLGRSAVSLTCGGWIFSRLTGELAVDSSDGSAPFTDIGTGRYSTELLDLYDMEWARRLLPEQRDDGDRVAALSESAASRLGLPAGTPVVMAPYDIASTAIGVGAVRPGQACTILGTTLCTEVVTDQVDLGRTASGLTVALGLPGLHLRAFPTLAGGEVIQWACGLMGLGDPADLGELARAGDAGAAGLAFLPYLSPAGERAPFLDPQARGALVGLSLEHGREDIARAVLEGLSLVVKDCLAASLATPTELRICGGGASSAVWSQMIADVTGIPVLRTADSEAGARGAFLVGMAATGRAGSVREAAEPYIEIREVFQPDQARAARYAELYADFVEIRQTTASAWPRLAAMRRRSKETP